MHIREPERVASLYPHELSGGMGQRVMIAMMVVREPDLLIADEPTSALDVSVRIQVLSILDELVTRRGMGLVFISHDLNLVSKFCDRVIVMYAGRIVETLDAKRLHEATHPYTRGLLSCLALDQRFARAAAGACSATRPGRRRHHDDRVKDLTVVFGDSTAVKDTSFSVAEGESFGLVGESGSGKSTILRTIMGLKLELVGHDPRRRARSGQTPRKQLARAAQMVFQDPYASLHPRYVIGHRSPSRCRSTASRTRRAARPSCSI